MQNESLYFIAIIPPEPINSEILKWKHLFADQFNAKQALKSPPHITLHMPFKYKIEKEEKLIHAISRFANTRTSFLINLENYGAFPPRVIYIRVVLSEPLASLKTGLTRMAKQELNLFNANYKERPFHPHMTLAFRDLKKPKFLEAWPLFEDKVYETSFEATDLVLLKHNGKHWDVHKTFDFMPSS
ncbi:MAG: 2'-5' RNA ligase family protein [Bacteroidota bacterium]